MEMAGHGDLLEYIKLRGAIDEAKGRTMFRQLLSAVEYMHSITIVHRYYLISTSIGKHVMALYFFLVIELVSL